MVDNPSNTQSHSTATCPSPDVLLGGGTLSTSATDGFVEISSSAGVPTGVPTSHSGFVPLDIDTTDNRLYFYNGSWQRACAKPAERQCDAPPC